MIFVAFQLFEYGQGPEIFSLYSKRRPAILLTHNGLFSLDNNNLD